jgi:hypothetical protein
LEKWQARGNQNQNPNIQNISTEIRDEGPKIAVVTHAEEPKQGWMQPMEGNRLSNG